MADQDPQPYPRLLSQEGDTRHVQLSASYDTDVYWHGALKMTVASFCPTRITLHRMVSDETAVSFCLTPQEMSALLQSYTAYRVETEAGTPAAPAYDPLDDGLDDHPF